MVDKVAVKVRSMAGVTKAVAITSAKVPIVKMVHSGFKLEQECYRVLVSLKSWPGQLLSLNPCLRPKILARMLFFGDFVFESSNS